MHHNHPLQYSFLEYSQIGHPVKLHQFGADRVAAFNAHRHLEQEGKKVGAVINTRVRHSPDWRQSASQLFSRSSKKPEKSSPLSPAT